MKKTILQGSVLALLLLGVANEGHWAGWQGSARSQGTVLEVAVPDKATVTRKQGASLTGIQPSFNQTSLTLSAEGYSEKVPLTQVQAIAFQGGDIWVEGQRLPARIRGFIKTWSGVPVSVLNLQNPPRSANLNLNGIENPEELKKLLSNNNKVRVLSKISFDSPRTMTVETFTMPKP
ncbi:hypothetical protein [Microcystis aeruginosa]|uniref:hypothetical protein n=1 Tax=Microcystis aeruginosa TaxID=1126 RepID=UPI00056A11D7|nr:hypothetical protein [Microcystis aeruginosa]